MSTLSRPSAQSALSSTL
ncbi:hypothetical protein C370_04329, partial [Cryptococcus neoformans A1-35-8]